MACSRAALQHPPPYTVAGSSGGGTGGGQVGGQAGWPGISRAAACLRPAGWQATPAMRWCCLLPAAHTPATCATATRPSVPEGTCAASCQPACSCLRTGQLARAARCIRYNIGVR